MPAPNPLFFLIDDDIDDKEIFQLSLNRIDPAIRYCSARDGFEAMEMFNNDPAFKPDFIILDLNMPRMDGRQCLVELKKNPRSKDIPVFIYSTSISPEDAKKLIASGADSLLIKPSDIEELISFIKMILIRDFNTN